MSGVEKPGRQLTGTPTLKGGSPWCSWGVQITDVPFPHHEQGFVMAPTGVPASPQGPVTALDHVGGGREAAGGIGAAHQLTLPRGQFLCHRTRVSKSGRGASRHQAPKDRKQGGAC